MVLLSFSSLVSYFFYQVSITGKYWSCKPNKRHPTQGAERPIGSGWTTANWTQLASCPGTAWSGLGWFLSCKNLSQCREVGLRFHKKLEVSLGQLQLLKRAREFSCFCVTL